MTFQNDPQFSAQAVETRVQNLWMQLHLGRAKRDLEPLQPYFSPALYSREEAALAQDIRENRMRCAGRPAVLNSSLTLQGTAGGVEILECRLLTRYIPQTLAWDSRACLSNGSETFFREVWTLARPEGTKTIVPGKVVSVHCPGCGAALSLYKSAKCPMCGSLTKVPTFSWTVTDIVVRVERNP